LERLAHHPAAIEAVRAELAEGESGMVDAVGAETLRVRPVVMDVGRQLSDPVVLGEHTLPAGTTVMPGIYLVHLDDRNHSDPTGFDPARFAGQRPSKDTWLPFGGGRRRCLGAGLAEMELRVILSTILARWVPIPTSDRAEQPRLRGITLAPEHNARLKMVRRPLAGGP
jgi:cytochrome P450 family 135